MEDYIREALQQGYIRPSKSPASAKFFLWRKGGGLHPCFDYRGLNRVSVKYPYPLLLVPSALEQLRVASMLKKLDLHTHFKLYALEEDMNG